MISSSSNLGIELDLAAHPRFGDWRAIANRTLTYYLRGLEHLATRSGAAEQLFEQLKSAEEETRFRVLGDPVMRVAISDGLSHVKMRLPVPAEANDVLRAATLVFGSEHSPTEPGPPFLRVGLPPHRAWVWRDDSQRDVVGEKFVKLFTQEISTSVSSQPATLRTPTAKMMATLQEGRCLLHELLPALGESVLAHVHAIGIVDTVNPKHWDREVRPDLCQSVSTHAIPGTVFFSPSVLRSPWHAAEALLHEAAHKKLSDLVLTRSVFRAGFAATESRTIRAIWNRSLSWNPSEWSIDRALFALHFYVHVAAFYHAMATWSHERRMTWGPPHVASPAAAEQTALNRARFLADRLGADAGDELGNDGQEILKWLNGLLDGFVVAAPRDRLKLTLLLDRYDKESKEIALVLEKISPTGETSIELASAPYDSWSSRRLGDHLVQSEIVAAFRILSTLGEATPPAFAFYDGDRWSAAATSNASPDDVANTFRAVRTFLSSTVRNADTEAMSKMCRTRTDKTLIDLVEDAVEHAGRHFDTLVKRIVVERRAAR